MEFAMYIELNVAGIVILGLIWFKMNARMGLHTDKQLFVCVLLSAIVLFGLDTVWGFIHYGFLPLSPFSNAVVNGLYLWGAGVLGFFWALYTEYKLGSHVLLSRRRLGIFTAPMVILGVLCLSSIWTGWIFYVDAQNIYHRGNLFLLQVLLGYGYVIFAGIRAISKACCEKNEFNRAEYRTLASFVVMPLLCGIIQTLYTLPVTSVGITWALLLVFITFQDHQISLDHLTQLNNRTQLKKYLSGKMSISTRKNRLFLLIMDVDAFKKINDTFGHLEGDLALIRVADTLREVCGRKNCFVCRYGGDEFVVVYECTALTDALELQSDIHNALSQKNRAANASYPLAVSIGCAELTDQNQNYQHLISDADAALYKNKAAHKQSVLGGTKHTT